MNVKITPLIQGALKLDGKCLALCYITGQVIHWIIIFFVFLICLRGDVSVLATQRRRNNGKDINTEKVTPSHQADFLCKYERNEILK